MRWIASFVLCLQLASGQAMPAALQRIRAKTPVDSVPHLEERIAGHYVNPSKELIKQTGPALAGENLYIFPDNSYVYCEWTDVMLNTVFDKGTWTLAGGILVLRSDPEITWNPELERRFLAVRRVAHGDEVLLVGIEKSLPYFEKEAGSDPELMLEIVGLQREGSLSQAASMELKAKLMREAWRPEFFDQKPKNKN